LSEYGHHCRKAFVLLQSDLAELGNDKFLLPGIWPSIGLKTNLQYLHVEEGQYEEEFQIEFYLL
jgi:hypothetical protein